jgi:leucyl aminopeptidase
MKINFRELGQIIPSDPVLIFPIGDDKKLSPLAMALNKQSGGSIAKALGASLFSGKRGQYLAITMPEGVKTAHVLLAGIGKAKDMKTLSLENLGGSAIPRLYALGAESATFVLEGIKESKVKAPEAAARIGHGAHLRNYRFDKYHTKTPADEKPKLKEFSIAAHGSKSAAAAYAPLNKLAEGVFFTRDLVTEPANIIYPASLAAKASELKSLGVGVKVLGVAEMEKLGMGALLGVGQGSARESKMVILTWNGASKDGKNPLAFVGKGVTFDTGGISIKPAGGMEEMKWDMGGAGVVIGLMKALAGRKAKVNVVGVAGLVENMPDGNAQRPGDVVTSMSGQTIEVLNTDAEGRLVLADALWYTQKNFKPKFIIDLATLTGAIIVALGTSRAGLFSNNDQLSERLFKTGEKTGEEVWRLPLGDVYDKQINSDIADMQNIGKDREAGSITAAQFLQRFVEKDVPWAHLDIAGVAWSKKPSDLYAKGATAFGVRLLNQLVADYYER